MSNGTPVTAQVLQIIQILLAAEPAVVNAIHDLLTGHSGETDAQVLAGDKVIWQDVQAKAREQLGL